jgi:hypothetical protein
MSCFDQTKISRNSLPLVKNCYNVLVDENDIKILLYNLFLYY